MPLRIDPYKLNPVPPRLALLLENGNVLHEDDGECQYFDVPKGTQIWGSYDTVGFLMAQEQGEALAWNGSPIRWHPRHISTSNRGQNTNVLRLDFPAQPIRAIEGLGFWRDWLSQYGATTLSSMGSSAFSLLRARLPRPLWCSIGELPPIYCTIGGRQELGVKPGTYTGEFRHYDLQAAYAKTLGHMRYGGRWREVSPRYPYQAANSKGMLCFVRARIEVPELSFGPLPRRPKGRPTVWQQVLFPTEYPTHTTIQGVWTTEELDTALEVGCKLKKILNVWVHITENDTDRPFAVWWKAIQDGRKMPGFAGMLAKATGNALWGQFCISEGKRSIQSWRREHGQLVRIWSEVEVVSTRPPAFDLAETITGRVRAKLYGFVTSVGSSFISAHTDGAWIRSDSDNRERHFSDSNEWRTKDVAERIDILTPQSLRYRTESGSDFLYCMAGIPSPLAVDAFKSAWVANGLGELTDA